MTVAAAALDVPAGDVTETVIGDAVLVQGPGLVVSVQKAGESHPADGEQAKTEMEIYAPIDLELVEVEDGWVMTFTNKGGAGTNYWVASWRSILGEDWWCTATVSSAEQQHNAEVACRTLR
jgi:hypothetical protein